MYVIGKSMRVLGYGVFFVDDISLAAGRDAIARALVEALHKDMARARLGDTPVRRALEDALYRGLPNQVYVEQALAAFAVGAADKAFAFITQTVRSEMMVIGVDARLMRLSWIDPNPPMRIVTNVPEDWQLVVEASVRGEVQAYASDH